MSAENFIPHDGSKIGILGKGGAGKSTTCVLVARGLRAQGFRVAVLNADATNVGLHQALGIAHPPRALLEYLGGPVFTGGAVTCPVDDPLPLQRATIELTTLNPGYVTRTDEGIYLLEGGRIVAGGPGGGCDGPVSKIARDIRIVEGGHPVLTLIDFKAGLEDVARGVVTGLDAAIVVVDPTRVSIALVEDLCDLAEAIHAGARPASRHLEDPDVVDLYNRQYADCPLQEVCVVLNRIRNHEVEDYVRAALAGTGARILGTVPEDPGIATAWLYGQSLVDPGQGQGIVQALLGREAVLHHLAQPERPPLQGRT